MNGRGRRPLDGGRQVDLIFRIDTYWPDSQSADADGREDLGYLTPLRKREVRGAMVRQAARDETSKTKWSRRDLLTRAAGAFGVVATQSLHAAGNRVDRVVGAWAARAGGRVSRRSQRMCAVCEVRGATYDGRFCSSMCGWASVLGGKVRDGRKRDVQTAVQGGRVIRGD